jgi:hypothetical protein
MAIDDLIAAGVRPPQVDDPQTVAMRAMQMRDMQQRSQLAQLAGMAQAQGMQLQGIQLEQAKQDFQDQQKWRQAYSDANGDLDQAYSLAAQRGVGWRTLAPIREQVTKLAQERANLDKTQSEALDLRHDRLNALLMPVENETDPVKQKAAWNAAVQRGVQEGDITPQAAAQMPYQGPQGVKATRDALTTSKWLTARGAALRGEAAAGSLDVRRQEWSAKQAADASKDLATRLGASKDQNDYNQILQDAGQTLPYSIVKKFEGRNADEAQFLGMTPAEQAKAMKESPEKLPTEYSLAYQRTNPNDPPAKRAADAMRFVDQSRLATRPVQGVTVMVPNEGGGYTATKVVPKIAPGQSVGPGAVTPASMSSLNVPTANTRGMAEKAPRVIEFVDRMNQLLDQNEKQLGPLKSRWAEFTAGKIGAPDQNYTKLRTDAGLLQTALMNMHVGARGGGQIMDHFRDLINVAIQDPENLRAALGEIRDYASRVQSEGGVKGAPAPGFQPGFTTPGGSGTAPQPGMVRMRAPNSTQTKDVPADQVQHYKSRGATVVTQP